MEVKSDELKDDKNDSGNASSSSTNPLPPSSSTSSSLSSPSSSPLHQLNLRIKSSEHPSSDLTITTPTSATVEQLKENVRTVLGSTSRGRYLRLISSGRLLAPDTAGLNTFPLKEGSVVHAVLAAAGVRGGQQASLARSDPRSSGGGDGSGRRNAYRGSGIGANGLILARNRNGDGGSDEEDDSDDDDIEEGRERLGFDRLRAEGLSRSEIAVLRTYFARQINRFIQQQTELNQNNSEQNDSTANTTTTQAATGGATIASLPPNNNNNNENNDDPRIERLRMEDAWMQTQGPHSEFRLNLNASNPLMSSQVYLRNVGMMPGLSSRGTVGTGRSSDDDEEEDNFMMNNGPGRNAYDANRSIFLGTDRDFAWGFFLGYFMGVVMMFWVWMPTVPHKQKVGILAGMCFQLILKMLVENDSFLGNND